MREKQTTQTAVAKTLGVAQQNFSDILQGKGRYLGVDHIDRYRESLGLSASEFLQQLGALAYRLEADAAAGKPPPPGPGPDYKAFDVTVVKRGRERSYGPSNDAAVEEALKKAGEEAATARRAPPAPAKRRHRR